VEGGEGRVWHEMQHIYNSYYVIHTILFIKDRANTFKSDE